MCIKAFCRKIKYWIIGEYSTDRLVKIGLRVGNNFVRMEGCFIDPGHCWLITIGDGVYMGARVHVLAHDGCTLMSLGLARIGRVTIGNHVFIGAESIILPGVTIGDYSIIGAGSVVSRSIPTNSIAVGNPARVVGSYSDFIEKNRMLMQTRPVWDEAWTVRGGITEEQKTIMWEKLADGIGFVE